MSLDSGCHEALETPIGMSLLRLFWLAKIRPPATERCLSVLVLNNGRDNFWKSTVYIIIVRMFTWTQKQSTLIPRRPFVILHVIELTSPSLISLVAIGRRQYRWGPRNKQGQANPSS